MIAVVAMYDFIIVVIIIVITVVAVTIFVTFLINSALSVPYLCLQYANLSVLPFCDSLPFYCNNIVVYV